MTRISRLARRICSETRASAVIELSFILPIILLMFAGMIDLTRVAIARIDMEQAAQRATDFALAKLPTSASATYLQTEAAAAAGVEASAVTAEFFLECNGTRQGTFTAACPTGQVSGRFASVSIRRTVTMLFDWHSLSTMFNSDVLPSAVTVTGDSVVRFQ
jgi:Flp pilus assembly protein TadG